MLDERVRTWMAASMASTDVIASTMRMAVSRRVDTRRIPFLGRAADRGVTSGASHWTVTLRARSPPGRESGRRGPGDDRGDGWEPGTRRAIVCGQIDNLLTTY
jgi:hypothetical protein